MDLLQDNHCFKTIKLVYSHVDILSVILTSAGDEWGIVTSLLQTELLQNNLPNQLQFGTNFIPVETGLNTLTLYI